MPNLLTATNPFSQYREDPNAGVANAMYRQKPVSENVAKGIISKSQTKADKKARYKGSGNVGRRMSGGMDALHVAQKFHQLKNDWETTCGKKNKPPACFPPCQAGYQLAGKDSTLFGYKKDHNGNIQQSFGPRERVNPNDTFKYHEMFCLPIYGNIDGEPIDNILYTVTTKEDCQAAAAQYNGRENYEHSYDNVQVAIERRKRMDTRTFNEREATLKPLLSFHVMTMWKPDEIVPIYDFNTESYVTEPTMWPASHGSQDGVEFGDILKRKPWLSLIGPAGKQLRHKEGCAMYTFANGGRYFQKVGDECVVYDEVRDLEPSEYKKSYPKFTSHAGGQVGGPMTDNQGRSITKSWHTPTSNSFLSQSTNETIRNAEGCALFAEEKGAKYFQLSGGKCHVYAEVGKGGKYGTGWNKYSSTTSGTRDTNLSKQRCKELSYGKVDGIQIVSQGSVSTLGNAKEQNWGSALPQGCLKRSGGYGHVYWNSGTGGRCNAYSGSYPCVKEEKSTACGGDCWKLTGGYEMKTKSTSGPCTGGYCWKIDDSFVRAGTCRAYHTFDDREKWINNLKGTVNR